MFQDMRLLWNDPLLGHAQHLLSVWRGERTYGGETTTLREHWRVKRAKVVRRMRPLASAAAAAPTPAPWANKVQPARTVTPRKGGTTTSWRTQPLPRGLLRMLIRMTRNKRLLPEVFSMRFKSLFLPRDLLPRSSQKVTREQEAANLKKSVLREEQELHHRRR